jgi:hypothetical protein
MKKHLEFYMRSMEIGEVPNDRHWHTGLCGAADRYYISKSILNMFCPTSSDIIELHRECLSTGWWGSGLSDLDPNKRFAFTPLRQTIVLFMAAINNEL